MHSQLRHALLQRHLQRPGQCCKYVRAATPALPAAKAPATGMCRQQHKCSDAVHCCLRIVAVLYAPLRALKSCLHPPLLLQCTPLGGKCPGTVDACCRVPGQVVSCCVLAASAASPVSTQASMEVCALSQDCTLF